MDFKIQRIELTPVHVPFRPKVRETMQSGMGGLGMAIPSDEQWLGEDFVICQMHDNEGNVGLGESFVWLPETGVSPNQIIDSVKSALGKYFIGENPRNIEKINQKMDNNVARNEVAKGLLDIACYDLLGKIEGKPAYKYMGDGFQEKIPLSALIPLTNIEEMIQLCDVFRAMGFKSFRLKLGKGVDEDYKIMMSIRESLGSEVKLRVDYNQAYSPEDAIQSINRIEPFKIDFAEQPVRATDFLGMSYVQKNVKVPLMAHESFFSINDFQVLVELNAVGVLGINSERPGGVTKALQAIKFAKEKKIYGVLHNQPLGIATAMHLHLASANPDFFIYPTELFGDIMIEDDLIKNPIKYRSGYGFLPKGSGYGVELDTIALKKYAIGETITIK